jgi:hypothetical protein
MDGAIEHVLKLELVTLAKRPDANLRQLCRRFGVSPKTAYKWIDRFDQGGAAALFDRSRRPHASPMRTDDELEQRVCAMRVKHPAWGGRKIHARLLALGHKRVPATSTIIGGSGRRSFDDVTVPTHVTTVTYQIVA